MLYGASSRLIGKSGCSPAFGTMALPVDRFAPSIHGECTNALSAWQLPEQYDWTLLDQTVVDFSTSAGCGTCCPSRPEPIEFWKKHVRPVCGLCPIIAMSLNTFVCRMPLPSSET